MKIAKLKTMSAKELQERLDKTVEELINLKFEVRLGQEKDYSAISKKKKEIARMKTLLQAYASGTMTPVATEKKTKKPEKVSETKVKHDKQAKTKPESKQNDKEQVKQKAEK